MKIILLLFIPCLALAETSCLHPAVCALAKSLDPGDVKEVFQLPKDTHHFHLKISETKKLKTTNLLILPNKHLVHGLSEVSKNRAGVGQQTYILGRGLNPTLSHFWLYPKIACQLRKDLASQLNLFVVSKCQYKGDDKLQALKEISNKPFLIVNHSSSEELLRSLGFEVVVLSTGHHHGKNITFEQIKSIERELNQAKRIWWLKEEVDVKFPLGREWKNKLEKTLSVRLLGSAQEAWYKPYNDLLTQLTLELK